MSDFPPIGDEFRPRAKLKGASDRRLTDEEIDTNARVIGKEWGASTRIAPETLPLSVAPVVSIRGYFPDYLDRELAVKAAERGVTKTFLLLEALSKAGYRVDEADFVEDRRNRR